MDQVNAIIPIMPGFKGTRGPTICFVIPDSSTFHALFLSKSTSFCG